MANDWDTVDDFFGPDFATDVVYDGNTLAGILYERSQDRLAVAAGLQYETDRRVMLRVAECEAIQWTPAPDQTITIDGTDRIVQMVTLDSTENTYSLTVQEETARA